MDETLAMNAQSELNTLLVVLANRVQQTNASGSVVAAGGAITPDANLVLVQPPGGGNIRVKVTATTTFSSGAGVVTPFLQTGDNGGALVTQVAGAQTTDGVGSFATTLVVSLPPGTASFQAHWQTTAGDAAATVGHGATGVGATLLVEQIL